MSSFDKNTFASWSHVYSLILILIKIEPTEQHSYWERHSTIPQMNQWLTGEKSYLTILFSPKGQNAHKTFSTLCRIDRLSCVSQFTHDSV